MAGAIVQQNKGAQNTGAATVTPTISSGATAGNLLVLLVASDDYRLTTGSNRPESSGYALVTGGAQQGFLGHYMWTKTAAGGETSVSYTIGSASPSTWMFFEASGLDLATAPTTAGAITNTSAATYTTQTITPAANDLFIIATIAGSLGASQPTAMSGYTDSFTLLDTTFTTLASGTRDSLSAATRRVTSPGGTGYQTTATYNPSHESRSAIIAAYKEAGGGPTPIPLAESASSAEALTVTVTAPLADAGASTEAPTESAAVPIADTGSAADALATPNRTIPLADAGAEAETILPAVAAPLADTGSAAQSLTLTSQLIPLADAGSASDALDNGLGTSKNLADTGAAAETLAVSVGAPLADTASAADALSVPARTIPLADTGSGAETLTEAAAVGLSDTGSAADALDNGLGTSKSLADAGSAVDTLTVVVTPALADSGSAGQTLGANAAVPLSDIGAATDTLTVLVALALADVGSALDTLVGSDVANVQKSLSDAGSASDALSFVPGLITGRPAVTGDPGRGSVSGGVVAGSVSGDPVPASATGVF